MTWEDVPGNNSGTHLGPVTKLCLHSTEGGTVEGAVRAYTNNNSWPHGTLDTALRRKVKHLEWDVAARSLSNIQNYGVETNRAGVIQFEVVGTAGTSIPWMSDADCDWLGSVLAEVGAECPLIPLIATTKPWVGGEGFGYNAAQRMSADEWRTFAGVCAHQHVPENDHWDAPFRIDRILGAAGGDVDMTPEEHADLKFCAEQMKRLVDANFWGTDAARLGYLDELMKRPAISGDEVRAIVAQEVAKIAAGGSGAAPFDISKALESLTPIDVEAVKQALREGTG